MQWAEGVRKDIEVNLQSDTRGLSEKGKQVNQEQREIKGMRTPQEPPLVCEASAVFADLKTWKRPRSSGVFSQKTNNLIPHMKYMVS